MKEILVFPLNTIIVVIKEYKDDHYEFMKTTIISGVFVMVILFSQLKNMYNQEISSFQNRIN